MLQGQKKKNISGKKIVYWKNNKINWYLENILKNSLYISSRDIFVYLCLKWIKHNWKIYFIQLFKKLGCQNWNIVLILLQLNHSFS